MANFIQSTYRSISRKHSTERVANAVFEFLERPEIKNVLAILDFRDFKSFEIYVPGSNSTRVRRINDDFLNRALRSYHEMSNIANGLEYLSEKLEHSLKTLVEEARKEEINIQEKIRQGFESKGFDVQTEIGSKKIIGNLGKKRSQIIENIDRSQIKKFHESFTDEVVVRGWFVDFLDGLARFENWIESGLTTADELKPFLIHWIEMIGDRDKRRKGGSSFYDSLFLFIHEAGYKEVINLFRRYKYDIPKPTYSEVIIEESCLDTKLDQHESDIKRAVLLSRAAKLCYEDPLYIKDWVLQWSLSFIDTKPRKNDSSTKTVFREVVDFLHDEKERLNILEGKDPYEELNISFCHDEESNDFAVAFTLPLKDQKRVTIVAFRGTVNIQNWITNFKTKLTSLPKDIDISLESEQDRSTCKHPNNLKYGGQEVKVHRGFLKSWHNMREQVFKFVDKENPDSIFLTGHSLGGAIAVIAAVDFRRHKNYQDKLRGVYTFGQPKVGNRAFANYFNKILKVPMARFVNNSDLVPRIPTLAGAFRYARNIGKWYYFSAFGRLVSSGDKKLWFVIVRDRIMGLCRFLINILNNKIILVSDHDISIYARCTKENLDRIESELK